MNAVIVGLGYFGKIIATKLTDATTVDPYNPDATYKSIDDVQTVDNDTRRWFITTPASTHHTILKQLFAKGVKNIWVEKPICSNYEDTLDVFATIPDGVFLYCDFTWLQHAAVKTLGDAVTENSVKHIELKWLNDGSMIPSDVNIVSDLAVHPLSIITYFLIKSKDTVKETSVKYATKNSVLICGCSATNGITFNIEVSNSSMKKRRGMSVYCKDTDVYRWYSDNEFYIENIGEVAPTDAIEKNIENFFNRNSIGYPLDIARTLEMVNKQFCALCN